MNSTMKKSNCVGGQFRELMGLTKSFIKTSGNIVNDLALGLSNVIGGITNGLEIVAGKAGSTIQGMSDDVALVSTKVFKHVGDLGMNVAKGLGNVVEVIPILGRPTAYVVKGTGRGIYYVVTTVGDVAGETLKGVGKIGKRAGDVVVFTIVATSNLTEDTIKRAGKMVQRVTHMVNNRKHGKTKKTTRKRTRTRRTKKGGMRHRRRRSSRKSSRKMTRKYRTNTKGGMMNNRHRKYSYGGGSNWTKQY